MGTPSAGNVEGGSDAAELEDQSPTGSDSDVGSEGGSQPMLSPAATVPSYEDSGADDSVEAGYQASGREHTTVAVPAGDMGEGDGEKDEPEYEIDDD